VAEIDLAGHPTLATAYVILDLLKQAEAPLRFQTRKSGPLTVARAGDRLVLDFPAMPPAAVPADWRASSRDAVAAALGRLPEALLAARDLIAIFPDEETVRGLKPDFAKVAALDGLGLLVTAPGAPGSGADFVSRFFAPKHDIMEDPVTGSAHCELIPYWAARLGKSRLFARQVSRRGGEIWCEDRSARVRIGGRCAFFMRGTIEL
jgi:PhzF family phenazine biosynthesis protein